MRALETRLTDRLMTLHTELGLSHKVHFCAISQVAIGADLIFCRACKALNMPQRIFLPQHEDAYLTAKGSDGTPDFHQDEQREARLILHSEHVIERRIVSQAADRTLRFEDTNRAIIAESDMVICLLGGNRTSRPGGTAQLIELASENRLPVLVLEASVKHDKLQLMDHWHRRELLLERINRHPPG